uniref:Chitin-binding type-2 domain-containing protein n=1 Tax=Parascaris univalens TaxID=6257 RepID=A0A915CGJ2_PARUN
MPILSAYVGSFRRLQMRIKLIQFVGCKPAASFGTNLLVVAYNILCTMLCQMSLSFPLINDRTLPHFGDLARREVTSA